MLPTCSYVYTYFHTSWYPIAHQQEEVEYYTNCMADKGFDPI